MTLHRRNVLPGQTALSFDPEGVAAPIPSPDSPSLPEPAAIRGTSADGAIGAEAKLAAWAERNTVAPAPPEKAAPNPVESTTPLRDEAWLAERLQLLRDVHFADAPRGYPITTRFAARAQYRYGSIFARARQTIITVNRLFADPVVPAYVVDATLAHELAHYVHGFGSGLPRLYADPHRGGVVDKELERRGLGELYRRAEQWRKANWDSFYESRCGDILERRKARDDCNEDAWDAILDDPSARTLDELRARARVIACALGYTDGPPYAVEWLRASTRQAGLSYWFSRERALRVHGLLAMRRVPAAVVDFELAYWAARMGYGAKWQQIDAVLRRAGLGATVDEALRWRRSAWTAFRKRHHPLGA